MDLPAPFSPIRAWISPDFKVRSTPLSTSLEPKAFEIPFMVISISRKTPLL
ncbi:hypothetical protein [Phascolarctobacterium faecium]|uniref:hypothetical protein n=1 Tax=Phascolarctobacterium faecium TaxID=33025 RepID=UPI0032C03996